MRLNPIAYGVLAVLLFATPVAGAVATGAWQATGGPGAGAGGGGGGQGGGGTGPGAEAGGQGGGVEGGQGGGLVLPEDPDVMDVRGRTAIGDVAAAWTIPLAEILEAFGLPADTPPATQLRELESDTFSVAAMREWLAVREGS